MSTAAMAADVNVLVLGSTRAYTSYNDAQTFNVQSVADELRNILTADSELDTVAVDFESLETSQCYYGNLLTYRYHVSGYWYWEGAKVRGTGYPSDRDDRRLPLLRGETKNYDYVVILDDPALMETFPGKYMQGVKAIVEETTKGNATPVLLMPWPGNASSSSVEHYKEVVYRAGRELGCEIAPAALAWENEGSIHGTSHPSPEGAYLAAASIYSQIFHRSASSTTYKSASHALADRVETVVDDNRNTTYAGRYSDSNNPLKIKDYANREWSLDTKTSGSTESGIKSTLIDVMESDWNNWRYGGTKKLSVWRNYEQVKHQVSHFFRHPGNGGYPNHKVAYDVEDDTNFYPFYRLNENRNNAFHMPLAIMWMELLKEHPDAPFNTAGHISTPKNMFAAYQITQLTGRCPLPPKPDPVTTEWTCWKIGYEMAWQNSTLQARAPGFKAVASHYNRYAVDPEAPETMRSFFVLPPEETVTVTISTNQPWATVSPSQLTFTPGNYDQVQNVTVSVTGAAPRGAAFDVTYTTSSADEVCDGLTEKWQYRVNEIPTTGDVTYEALYNKDSNIELLHSDTDVPAQSLSIIITQQPINGTVEVSGHTAIYTPFENYSGPDSFAYSVNDGQTSSTTDGIVSINVVAPGSYGINLLVNPGAEYGTTGWTGNFFTWDSFGNPNPTYRSDIGSRYFRMSNAATATAYQDVDLSYYAHSINAGIQYVELEALGVDKDGSIGAIELQFRDVNDQVIGTPYYELTASSDWRQMGTTLKVPANAVVARVLMHGEKGNSNRAYFDNFSFIVQRPVNSAPVALQPAPGSVAENVPTVITLAASDVDRLPADTLTYVIVDQPSNGSITGWNDGMPIYTPNPGYLGPDSFTFRVNDGHVDSANVETASLVVRPNEAPVITFNTPTENHVYFTLSSGLWVDATVTDDGGPVNPGAVSISWQQLSGPETALIDNPNGADTAIRWAPLGEISTEGTYEFQITANDGELSSSEVITVTVSTAYLSGSPANNFAPQVDVDSSPTSGAVGETIGLKGADLTDPGAKPVVYRWQQISGLGTATFADEYDLTSDVTFDAPSTYVLRFTGDDGIVTAYEDLVIEITGPAKVHDQSVRVHTNSPGIPITLTATAALPQDFIVIDQPVNGFLSGDAPNLVYTPNPGFIGSDVFTFRASDGTYDSAVGTISISVGHILSPVADAYVRGAGNSGNNFGEETTLVSKWVGSPDNTYTRLGYLGFDLSTVPGDVTAAILRLYSTSSSTGKSRSIQLVSDDNWGETTITLNNAPAPSGVDLASFVPQAQSYVEIDITTAVQNELVGDKEISLYLATTASDYITFASREHATTAWRPVLKLATAPRVNVAPVATDSAVETGEGQSVGVSLQASDANGDPLTYSIVSQPANGTLSQVNGNSVIYTPTRGFIGSDSFTFVAIDGTVDSNVATVTITVNEVIPPNTAPVANDVVVATDQDVAAAVALDGTDADGDALIYSFTQPTNGTLSGTAPNLLYTPNPGFSGTDVFTFIANDGELDSNIATVSISVLDAPNNSPTADAGPDQTVVLGEIPNMPGLWYGTASGNINTSSPNPQTQLITNVASKTEDAIAGSTTEIYTGHIYDADGQISFTEHIDDKARIWIDGNLVLSNDAWNSRTSTSNLNLAPGWHTIEIRISNGSGGSGSVSGVGIGYDPNGGTAWQTLADPGDGSFLRVNTSTTGALATLDGTVSDPDGHPLTSSWSVVSGPASVSFADASTVDTTATFTVAGTYVLRLTTDDSYDQSSDDLVITVSESETPQNTAPVANDDSATTDQDTSVAVVLSGSDADGDSLMYSIVSGPGNGSLSGSGANRSYSPNSGFHGSDSFTYRVNDGTVDSNVATVTITVNEVIPPNTAPVANDVVVATDQEVAAAVALDGTDADGDALIYSFTQPINGTLSGTAPNLSYTPNAGFFGSDTFTYYVNDGTVDSNVATVTITVNEVIPPNTAPVANDVVVATDQDVAAAVALDGTDADGDALIYSFTQPTNGTLSGTAPNLTYTPNAGFFGTDTITFKVNDGTDDSNVATVTITVNDPIVIVPKTTRYEAEDAVISGGTVARNSSGFSGTGFVDYRNANGDSVEWTVVADLAGNAQITFGYALGSGNRPLEISVNGIVVDDSLDFPSTGGWRNWRETAVLTVPLNAGANVIRATAIGSSGANVDYLEATTQAPATAPVANDVVVTTDQEVAVAITLNATDADGDALIYSYSFTQPINGTLSGTAPNLSYTPNAGFFGSDTFTYYVNDGTVDSNVATVTITVNEVIPPNTAPVANDVVVTTDQDVAAAVALDGTDADGDALIYTVTPPANGTLSGTAPNLSYTPNAGFFGTDTFTYYVNDGTVDSNVATVTITVNEVAPPNTAPVANDVVVATDQDVAAAVALDGTDADGDALTYSFTQPTNGTLSGTAPNLTYTPNAGFFGTDTITFKVNDGTDDSNVATVTITVNDPIVIVPKTTRYEAEDAVISGGTVARNSSGFSGTGFVDYRNANGDSVEWTVVADLAGNAQITFGYALGSGNRPLEISVNGIVVDDSLDFPSTGGWRNWRETAVLTVPLNAGDNVIRATAIGSSGANVDYLDATTQAPAPGAFATRAAAGFEADATPAAAAAPALETYELQVDAAGDAFTLEFGLLLDGDAEAADGAYADVASIGNTAYLVDESGAGRLQEVRAFNEVVRWSLVVEALGEPVIVSWDGIKPPEGMALYLQEIVGGRPAGPAIDLTQLDEITCLETSEYQIVMGIEQVHAVTLQPGWNLISQPLVSLKLPTVNGAYDFDGDAWIAQPDATPLTAGKGYYVYASEEATLTTTGITAASGMMLDAGWNLVGTVEACVAPENAYRVELNGDFTPVAPGTTLAPGEAIMLNVNQSGYFEFESK